MLASPGPGPAALPSFPPHRSSAALLAWAWAALIVYASLFPFQGWRWPPGVQAVQLLRLPWPHYFIPFDIASNLAGYAPLGFLLALAGLRHGRSASRAALLAVLVGWSMSWALETGQYLLPQRVPSALDWLLNSAGSAVGAGMAWAAQRLGWVSRWDALRSRWLEAGHGGALALLLLWPAALVFPAPVMLGLGQIGPAVRRGLEALLDDVAWAEPLAGWLDELPVPDEALSPLADGLVVVLGLLGPCLLACTAARPGRRRLLLMLGAAVLGVLATTLSAALSFGPDHALAWRTPLHLGALLLSLLLALPLVRAPQRLAGALGLIVLTGLVMLVHQAPADPYFTQNLQSWEQGQFIRFHGLTQWLGWLWPWAAMAWLLVRLSRP